MDFFPFAFTILLLCFCALVTGSASSSSSDHILYPNFTSSSIHFTDGSIGFLTSPNGTFIAAMQNPSSQQTSQKTNFYLCVIHVHSNTIIWSANRDAPVSNAGTMTLSVAGIQIRDQDGSLKWSTPHLLNSSVSSLQLTEIGNLVLLDQHNAIVWESFRYPTDTIVMGQKLPVGVILSSAVSSSNLSVDRYSLSITASDAVLQWQNMTYWKLSMAANSTSIHPVEYMAINRTGLYLFGDKGSAVVIQVNLSISDFGIAKLDYSGQFSVGNLSGPDDFVPLFEGPEDKCRIPFICGTLGLCVLDADDHNHTCLCPFDFHASLQSENQTVCTPSDCSYSLSNSCDSTDHNKNNTGSSSFSYLSLGSGVDYFANHFTSPVKYSEYLSGCEDLCSSDCSCLGIFYDNSSNACYFLQNQLGSVMSSASSYSDLSGFVKAIVGPNSPVNRGQEFGFRKVAMVLLPLSGFFLLAAIGFFLWRGSTSSKKI